MVMLETRCFVHEQIPLVSVVILYEQVEIGSSCKYDRCYMYTNTYAEEEDRKDGFFQMKIT